MKRIPPMTTEVVRTEVGFDVKITHAAWQSYSRAVLPRANKVARAHATERGIWSITLTGMTDSGEPLTLGRETRVTSIVHYENR